MMCILERHGHRQWHDLCRVRILVHAQEDDNKVVAQHWRLYPHTQCFQQKMSKKWAIVLRNPKNGTIAAAEVETIVRRNPHLISVLRPYM